MFIPKTVLQAFRKFANAFLDRPIRKLASDIGIHATVNGCTLQVSDAGKSISCSVACKDGDEPLAESVSITSDLFEELAQSTGDIEFGPVESTENGSRFIVRWQTRSGLGDRSDLGLRHKCKKSAPGLAVFLSTIVSAVSQNN